MSQTTDNKTDNTSNMPRAPFKSAFEAEKAFYVAFVRRDINLMKQVWSKAITNTYCLHPGQQPLVGYKNIIDSWEGILKNQETTELKIEHQTQASNPGIAVHRITEHMTVQYDKNSKRQATFHAINVFQCIDDNWYMISHHAAPAPIVAKPTGATVH